MSIVMDTGSEWDVEMVVLFYKNYFYFFYIYGEHFRAVLR